MSEFGKEKMYSVQVTVQRTKIEYGFVSVLVTTDLIGEDGKLNTDKLFSCSIEAAKNAEMPWYPEQETISISPIQKPRECEDILRVNPLGINQDFI